MRKKTDLTPMQQSAITFAFERNHSLIRGKMGSGKTAIGLTLIQELMAEGHAKKVLIVAPPKVVDMVWCQEAERWEHLQDLRLRMGIIKGSDAYRWAVISESDIAIISFNMLPWLADLDVAVRPWDTLIIDETTKVKTTGAWWKALRRIRRGMKTVVGLTGTLQSEGLEELYPQIYLLDEGQALGRTRDQFLRRYFIPVGKEWMPRSTARRDITAAIAHLVFEVDQTEYEEGLPELVIEPIRVRLNDRGQTAVAELRAEGQRLIATAKANGEPPPFAELGVLTQKMRQVACGFTYTILSNSPSCLATLYARGIPTRVPSPLGGYKVAAADRFIQEHPEPLIVVYEYLETLDVMQDLFPGPVLGRGTTPERAKQVVERWNAGKIPVLYLHPASAGHGLNLQHGGNHMLWISPPWGLDPWDQTIARLRRPGQQHDQVVATVIITDDTPDEAAWAGLTRKDQDRQETFDLLQLFGGDER